jgi:hypothetical protein
MAAVEHEAQRAGGRIERAGRTDPAQRWRERT